VSAVTAGSSRMRCIVDAPPHRTRPAHGATSMGSAKKVPSRRRILKCSGIIASWTNVTAPQAGTSTARLIMDVPPHLTCLTIPLVRGATSTEPARKVECLHQILTCIGTIARRTWQVPYFTAARTLVCATMRKAMATPGKLLKREQLCRRR